MTRKIIIVLCFLLSFITIKAQEKFIIDEVVAVVGNTPILRSELDILISQIDPDIDLTDKLQCETFKNLVLKKMMVHQAELDSLPINDDDVTEKMDNNLRYFERQLNSRANLEKYLGMTVDEYKRVMFDKVKNQMLAEKMQQKIQSEIKITPQEVKDFYAKLPKDSIPFISSEVEIAQIVLKPKPSQESIDITREQMQNLRDRLINGESFARLAGLYSEDPGSKKNGGLLPEFGRGEMVPEFERMAFTLKKDSISEVFESKFGFHIMKLIDKRGERVSVRHILIRPIIVQEDLDIVKQRLDSIVKLIKKDSNFCSIVKTFSEDDETKQTCGYFTDPNIGTQKIPYEYLEKDMVAYISNLKPGEFSTPHLAYSYDGTPYYRILYLKSETKPHVANLDQDWQRIQNMALDKKREQELEIWALKNKKTMYIYLSPYYIYCDDLSEWNSNPKIK